MTDPNSAAVCSSDSSEVRTPSTCEMVESVADVRDRVSAAKRRGLKVGFVPTMGALHAGHAALIEAARRECGFVVTSIFVNPTQFAPHEDLSKYPRPIEADQRVCAASGCDLIFHPNVATMYPEGTCSFVEVTGLSAVLEGKFRPTHFRGVTTIVLKLFNIVSPDVAYFGLKDYQQQTIIRRMCQDLDVPVEIRPCPTVREPDGLALSSRNIYLSAEERRIALSLSRCLNRARDLLLAGGSNLDEVRAEMLCTLKSAPIVQPDYATLIHPDSLVELDRLPDRPARVVAIVAARVGLTRLIDNLIIDLPA